MYAKARTAFANLTSILPARNLTPSLSDSEHQLLSSSDVSFSSSMTRLGWQRHAKTSSRYAPERKDNARATQRRSCTTWTAPFIALSGPLWHKAAMSPVETVAVERFVRCKLVIRHSPLCQSIYGPKFACEKAGLQATPRRGSLAMANSGGRSPVSSSQFFIVLTDDEKSLSKLAGNSRFS